MPDDSILPDGGDYARTQQGVNRVVQATRADQVARSAAAAAKPLPPQEIQRLKDNYYAFPRPLTE
jgi:hypothetical protein